MHGSNTAVVIQGEGSCTHKRQSPPSIGIGVGAAQPLMLPGTFGHGTAVATPSSLADTNPVGGIFVRIPLTSDRDKCKEFLRVQRAKARLALARELHQVGEITDKQLSEISKEAFEALD